MSLRANIADTCADVKIGGTISGSTLSGGVSIAHAGLSIVDYGALWGAPRFRASGVEVIGQPGIVLPAAPVPASRNIPLAVAVRPFDSTGLLTLADLDGNLDDVLAELTDPAGTLIQWTRIDGTELWIKAICLTSISVTQIVQQRVAQLPMTGLWPYWQEATLRSDTVNGAAASLSPAISGTVKQIANPSMVFAADGYFEDDTTGLRVTVSGSGGTPVTVARDATTGRWRVTQSGSDAPGLASWNDRRVMVLTKGGTFTSTASVTVQWRNQHA